MSEHERILRNQMEIMRAISYLLKCAKPDLVGKAGELDRFRDDLHAASKDTHAFLQTLANQQIRTEMK